MPLVGEGAHLDIALSLERAFHHEVSEEHIEKSKAYNVYS
jgi:hypothetical protein